MSNALAQLRRKIAALEGAGGPLSGDLFGLGIGDIDRHLGGGLARAAVHEVYADAFDDLAASSGFAAALALRAGLTRPLVWLRHRMAVVETGWVDAPGLVAFGIDPGQIIQVYARDGVDGLRAGREALGCSALGAVILELSGTAIDLVATRRLMRAAKQSGVAGFLVRGHGTASPSAATTRWRVRAAPSVALAANAPGHPRFDIELERHRGGIAPARWRVEWDCDTGTFRDAGHQQAALPRALAPASPDRQDAPARRSA